jgi:hypothetical protein
VAGPSVELKPASGIPDNRTPTYSFERIGDFGPTHPHPFDGPGFGVTERRTVPDADDERPLGRLSPYHGGARFVRADSKCTLAGVATATLHRCDLGPHRRPSTARYRELAKKAATPGDPNRRTLICVSDISYRSIATRQIPFRHVAPPARRRILITGF